MEKLFAQLLYSTLKDNPSAKETLTRLLKFYSENRELIRMVFTSVQSPAPPAVAAAAPEEQKKDCPQQEAGNPDIMQEYLNRII